MRRAYSDNTFYIDEQTNILNGIILGYAFCAQHEHGIRALEESFGIEKFGENSSIGSDRCSIKKIPSSLSFNKHKFKNKKYTSLTLNYLRGYHYIFQGEGVGEVPPVSDMTKNEEYVMSWSDDNFGISVKGHDSEYSKHLEDIYDRFLKKDIIITWTKPSTGGMRTSPSLLITSRLPQSFLDNLYSFEKDQQDLLKEMTSSGINEYLLENNKRCHKLIPLWADGYSSYRELQTKYKIVFSVTPINTEDYNQGIYTVEELQCWAKNVGPVMKKIEKPSVDFILTE